MEREREGETEESVTLRSNKKTEMYFSRYPF
jgi:hypothetical protein